MLVSAAGWLFVVAVFAALVSFASLSLGSRRQSRPTSSRLPFSLRSCARRAPSHCRTRWSSFFRGLRWLCARQAAPVRRWTGLFGAWSSRPLPCIGLPQCPWSVTVLPRCWFVCAHPSLRSVWLRRRGFWFFNRRLLPAAGVVPRFVPATPSRIYPGHHTLECGAHAQAPVAAGSPARGSFPDPDASILHF